MSFAANFQADDYKQFSPNISSSFQMDPAAYGSPSSTISSQGTVLGSENHQRPNFSYPPNYGLNINPGEFISPTPTLSKLPHYLRNSSDPKQQLQFSNDTLSWNAASASMNDVRSTTFFSPRTFDEKPKVIIISIIADLKIYSRMM